MSDTKNKTLKLVKKLRAERNDGGLKGVETFVTERDAELTYGLSKGTLTRLRARGDGPVPAAKIVGIRTRKVTGVLYNQTEMEKFIREHRIKSLVDAGLTRAEAVAKVDQPKTVKKPATKATGVAELNFENLQDIFAS